MTPLFEPVSAFSILLPSGWIIQAAAATEEAVSDMVDEIFGEGASTQLLERGVRIVPVTISADGTVSEVQELKTALNGLLHRYVGLVNSGDAGFWNPEEEDEVIAARRALEMVKREGLA